MKYFPIYLCAKITCLALVSKLCEHQQVVKAGEAPEGTIRLGRAYVSRRCCGPVGLSGIIYHPNREWKLLSHRLIG